MDPGAVVRAISAYGGICHFKLCSSARCTYINNAATYARAPGQSIATDRRMIDIDNSVLVRAENIADPAALRIIGSGGVVADRAVNNVECRRSLCRS